MRRLALAILLGSAGALGAPAAKAGDSRVGGASSLYVIAVGYNGAPPVTAADAEGAPPRALRFADDDAAGVFTLFAEAADAGVLLASPDAETLRKYPDIASLVRPPTLQQLRRAVAEVAARVAADRRAGIVPNVVFFYSGHGYLAADVPALALEDGALTTDVLYGQVIEPLAAGQMHVLVDACHAEAVVRPRDLHAAIVDVTPAQAEAYVQTTTLARYPSVGAIVAATRGAQAHEWEEYGSGVFTHELVSGLRGAADVNGDGEIEYSEIAAFLAAANRDVIDPRARLAAVVRVPKDNAHAALIDLRRLTRAGRLRGHLAQLGAVYVEDERGVRLLDVRAERGFLVSLVVPAGRPLFVRGRDLELEVSVPPGQTVSLDAAAFHSTRLVARGALDSALRRGLFATGFGPGYYLGYVDRIDDVAAIPVQDDPTRDAPAPTTPWQKKGAWIAIGGAGALAAGALTAGVMAWSSYGAVKRALVERAAQAARDQYSERRDLTLALSAGAVAAGVAAAILWRWQPTSRISVTTDGNSVTVAGRFP